MSNRLGHRGHKKHELIVEPWTILRLGRFRAMHGLRSKYPCSQPRTVLLAAEVDYSKAAPGGRILSDISVRCRRCEACLKAFAAMWAFRSLDELERADRARMVTLTFRENATSEQLRAAERSYLRLIRDKEARKARHEARKPTKLRKLAVVERGEQGSKRLHLHMLVTEKGPPIPREFYKGRSREHPRGCWLYGHATVKLIKQTPLRAARYVTKYLTKDTSEAWPSGRRVQASTFWGPGRPLLSEFDRERARQRREALRRSLERLGACATRTDGTSDSVPTCALLIKSWPTADECTSQTGPPNPSEADRETIRWFAENGADWIRIIPSNELPSGPPSKTEARYPAWDGTPIEARKQPWAEKRTCQPTRSKAGQTAGPTSTVRLTP